MARGTTLTLYKKYNIPAEPKRIKAIVGRYAKNNRKNDFSKNRKELSEYEKDIPIVINDRFGMENSVYDKKSGQWVDRRPKWCLKTAKDAAFGYVDSRDGLCCEQMMEWSFGSSFDCLVERFGLDCCSNAKSTVEITYDMAVEMLAALNYILGGNWSDEIERGMGNSYIETFTNGGHCDSYWKYVYRNKNRGKSKTFRIKKDGYDITVKCPVERKGRKNDEDPDYEAELEESNSCAEWSMENFRNALIAFLKSDNWDRPEDGGDGWLGYDKERKYKYILIYDYWG